MKSIRKEVLLTAVGASNVDSFEEEDQWVCTSKVEIDTKRVEVKHCLD